MIHKEESADPATAGPKPYMYPLAEHAVQRATMPRADGTSSSDGAGGNTATIIGKSTPSTETAVVEGISFVLLSRVEFDRSCQVRAVMNEEVVNEFADRMREKDEFPPVDLFYDGSKLWIGNGWHRLEAARRKGMSAFKANVQLGNRHDAIRFALTANAIQKGQRWTAADKRNAIRIALREFKNLSDVAVASMCQVSDKSVAGVRREIKAAGDPASEVLTTNLGNSEVESRKGADGKVRRMPAARRKACKKPEGSEQTVGTTPSGATQAEIASGSPVPATEVEQEVAGDCVSSFQAWKKTKWKRGERPPPPTRTNPELVELVAGLFLPLDQVEMTAADMDGIPAVLGEAWSKNLADLKLGHRSGAYQTDLYQVQVPASNADESA